MSEERMERKCVARSVPSKAAAADNKKSSDAAHKPWPRSNKKRESPGASGKNEVSRRNLPAPRGGAAAGGGTAADRRGRPRADATLGRLESSGLAEEGAEIGSVFVPGSKKQSLNHLLKFVYSPRERAGDNSSRAPPARRVAARTRAVAPHPHDVDLFLQASCQFAVKAGGDYSKHLVDPDLPISWDLVEHVVVRAGGASECPVCLGAPAAARATRCGHVYCWACLLHYVRVHDRAHPPCPVCAAPIDVAHLKSARAQRWTLPDEEICMRLVRRARGSTLVEPAPERDAPPAPLAPAVPRWDPQHHLPYAKLFTITRQQVREIIERERRELSDQILAEIDTSELEYLEEALRLLQRKEDELDMQPEAPEPEPADRPPVVVQLNEQATTQNKLDWFDVTEDDDVPTVVAEPTETAEEPSIEESGACSLNPEARPFVLRQEAEEAAEEFPLLECSEEPAPEEDAPALTEIDKDNQSKYFYFYQAEDGQQVFLHGVDVRLLCASWGALAAAPTRVRGRLLRRESFSLSHQSRKHMPCAAHLPLYCPYEVVELELQPPHVTRRALDALSEELERRARARMRAEREERRRERRAAAASRPPAAPRLASLAHFPPAATPAASHSPPSPPSPPSPQPQQHCSPQQHSPSALSFAKMAGSGGAWRVREQRPPPAAPPPPADDDEDAAPAPRTLCLSDAIEAALHAAPHASAPAPASKGARKKNKPKLLFSTGVQRAA